MAVNYGQAEIDRFQKQAAAGTLHFDPAAVDEVVRYFDAVISELRGAQRDAATLFVAGFGGFPSGSELQQGLTWKLAETTTTLKVFIEGAIRIQEGFLRAGGRISDADQKLAALQQIVQPGGGQR